MDRQNDDGRPVRPGVAYHRPVPQSPVALSCTLHVSWPNRDQFQQVPMSVEVQEATAEDRDRWDGYVERSPESSPFHQLSVLELLADHSGGDLSLLVGRKGQEVVGLFPVFALRKGPVTATLSPPPALNVSYLGPAMLNLDKLKRRKQERRRQAFVEGCLDWIQETHDPRYQRYVVGHGHDDMRPFRWNDGTVTPRYTYVVSLTADAETLLGEFSSDARRNIRDGDAVDYEVSEGGADAAARIIEQVQTRYAEQDRPYSLTPTFVRELYSKLEDGRIRPYVCRVDGTFAGGIVALALDETVYRWQGGVKPAVDTDFAVNDHLDWRIMQDAVDRGQTEYDLVGAGVPRVNQYKAKFNPDLRTYHEVEAGDWPVRRLVDLYRRLA